LSAHDQRNGQDLTCDELSHRISSRKLAEAQEDARRKQLEAEADLIDEKLKLALFGGGAFGIVGLVVFLLAALWLQSVSISLAGAGVGLAGFGVISAAQYIKIRGSD
tara:strand:+ start:775 stop:1095 length:321 start_codon:yes stop_codon:yes gene_type:complete